MTQFLKLAAIIMVAALMGVPAAYAADAPLPTSEGTHFAVNVKGPTIEGLEIYFVGWSGTKDSNILILDTIDDPVTAQVDGWYSVTIPLSTDLSKLARWCATTLAPVSVFDQGICTGWGEELKRSKNGVYILSFKPKPTQ